MADSGYPKIGFRVLPVPSINSMVFVHTIHNKYTLHLQYILGNQINLFKGLFSFSSQFAYFNRDKKKIFFFREFLFSSEN